MNKLIKNYYRSSVTKDYNVQTIQMSSTVQSTLSVLKYTTQVLTNLFHLFKKEAGRGRFPSFIHTA
jgi:hypothetical protein